MKSRATIFMLFAGVAAVWGIVLWKVFFQKSDTTPGPTPPAKAVMVKQAADTLLLNYRDPFRGPTVSQPVFRQAVPARDVAGRPKEEPLPPEQNIRYMGQITRAGITHGLIEINGTLHTVKRGETADGYRLIAVWPDSVRVKRNNVNRIVRINN